MKCAVVYYSRTGNNENVAQTLHQGLSARGVAADLIAIETARPMSKMWGAVKAIAGQTVALRESYDFSDYQGLVLCSPVWAGNMTPAIHELLMTSGGLDGVRAFNLHVCDGAPGSTRERIADMLDAQGAHVVGSRYLRAADLTNRRVFHEFVDIVVNSYAETVAAV